MEYITILPPDSLTKYVRYFWVLEGEACMENPYIHRGMADGCAELVFHYNGIFDELHPNGTFEKSFTSGLDAQSDQFRRFYIGENFGIFGAYLYPFAIPHLFSIPATELKNRMVDLNTLLGKEENGLEEKMMLATNTPSRVEILTQFLEGRLPKTKAVRPGVFETINYIIKKNGMIKVEALAERNFLSVRQFERNFKQFSGFGPKQFSRIVRFQTALQHYGKKQLSLTEIAYTMGYADQSHFIRDFREFSGQNPREYFSGKGEGTEWREI